jgi:leucyl aminopeptidase
MKINIDVKKPDKIKAELLAFLFDEDSVKKIKSKKEEPLFKTIEESIKRGDFRGEFENVTLLTGEGKVKRVLLLGLGKEKDVTTEKIRKVCSFAVSQAKELKLEELSFYVQKISKISDIDVAYSIVEGVILSNYSFDKYKADKKKKQKELKKLLLFAQKINRKKANEATNKARTICENVNFVRDMVNETSDVMNPIKISEVAKEIAKKNRLKITIMDEKDLKKKGMNLMLRVGQGSRYPPRFIVIEYLGDKRRKDKIALLGKGITFDSGGLNLKPTGYIENMKLDKAGAVTVLGIIKTLSELKTKVNVVGVMPCCENMIGPNAYKPGDIVKSYSGKTVEVVDTDAEGRLIMADALGYIEKNIKPSLIIDMATLTGSVLVAFGEYVAAMFSTKGDYAKKLFEAGQKTYERVWELPLYDEYIEEMKGDISDVKNLGYKGGRYAGTITAAAFLKNFVQKTPWIHIDIAGVGWYEKQRYYIPKGGTGFGVRLLVEFLKNFEK